MKNIKNIKKVFNNQKGFTLVELIIVIAILAVIAAIATPNLIDQIENSRKKTDVTNAGNIADAITYVIAQEDMQALGIDDKIEKKFEEGSGEKVIEKAIEHLQSEPKLKHGHSKADSGEPFFVEISTDGSIEVFSKDGGSEIFPEPDSEYE
ncbi:MAG: prepilin-type N-terminal cleavage/methylation domain-containing protein [Halanaerobiales bacterium]